MGGVFANNLEISGKSVQAQTIAAFPDVCMTPPENPATPPGVPVPYPNFAMASDTESGTGKVMVKGKEVNLKNKSDMKRTSGDEAGCAAKKGVITSKNMGKSYFNSWSSDVKFEAKPVVRMSDMTTNNHASPAGNAPPWPHIASINPSGINCAELLSDCNIQLHKHSDKTEACGWSEEFKNESEHMLQNAILQNSRAGKTYTVTGFGSYSANTAPCLCMEGPASDDNTPHGQKTRAQEAFAESCVIRDDDGKKIGEKRPKIKDAVDSEMKSIRENHIIIKKLDKETQDDVMECLEAVVYDHLERCTGKDKEEVKEMEGRVPGGETHGKVKKKRKRKKRSS